jgi:hypothetical protein
MKLGYFMTSWYILCSFGTFSSFGTMYQEKSGNHAGNDKEFYTDEADPKY